MTPRIIIESNIPFAKGLLDHAATVSYLPPQEITPESMRHTDALITRTRTRCDSTLLDGSRCSIIASATIGLDHVDLGYCRTNGIEVANAPGCNAPAVAQYVMSSIIAAYGSDNLAGLTIGIVGVGHVGQIVERWASQLGMPVLLCDPPRAEKEGSDIFCSLARIAREADIITFHTPLTKEAPHPTYHLAGDTFFRTLARRPMVINAARGPVVDTPALINAIDNGLVSHAVIDCWEGEPTISIPLLEKAFVATPHIAGYSRQGKIRATEMAIAAVARKFNIEPRPMTETAPDGAVSHVTANEIAASYDPLADTAALRHDPSQFEALRNNYNLRDETGCVTN